MSKSWSQLGCVLNVLCFTIFVYFLNTYILSTYCVEDSTLGGGQDTKVKMGSMPLGSFHSTGQA